MYTPVDANGVKLVIAESVVVALSILATGLRIWARRIKQTRLCFNDYAVFVALFLDCALVALIIVETTLGGLGQSPEVITQDSQTLYLKVAYPAVESVWAAANTAVKLSILHFYTTIFNVPRFHFAARIMALVITGVGLGATIQCLAICRPIQYQWDTTIDGVCGNKNLGILTSAIFNMITDLGLYTMPIPMLWNLQMPFTKKLALIGIFSLGLFICIITILRIYFTVHFIQNPNETSYNTLLSAIWLAYEPSLGIVNANLPLLKPILPRINAKVQSWTKHSSSSGQDTIEMHTKAGGDARKFQRLEDDLNVLNGTGAATLNEVTVKGPESILEAESGFFGHHPRMSSEAESCGNAITVTAEFDVQSNRTGSKY